MLRLAGGGDELLCSPARRQRNPGPDPPRRPREKRQITVAMPPELVDRIDACARKLSITRAAFIKLAISRAIENEG